MVSPSLSTLREKQGTWLLDLHLDGRVYRFATKHFTVADGINGNTYLYREGLEDFMLDLQQYGDTELSVSLSITSDVDWAKLDAQGHRLNRQKAVLYRHFEGMNLYQSKKVIEGVVLSPSYGEPFKESLEITIARSAAISSKELQGPTMVVDDTTWPKAVGFTIHEKAKGAFYPFVIGCPGLGVASSPGLMAEYKVSDAASKVIIAGHEVAATSVTLFNTKDGTSVSGSRAVASSTDNSGQTVSYVNFGSGGVALPDLEAQYYIGWTTANGGGIKGAGNATLRGVGEVVEYMLKNYTDLPVDSAGFANWSWFLNGFKIDTFINAGGVNVWSWVSNIMSLLPVRLKQGASGYYYQPMDYLADSTQAVAHLNADTFKVQRESKLATLSDEIANEITLEYARDKISNKYLKRWVITSEASSTDTRVLGNYHCKLSQQSNAYGLRPKAMKSDHIWDDITASLILQYQAAQLALPRRLVTYSGGHELEALGVGDVVTLTDSGISIDSAVCLVDNIQVGGSTTSIDLMLLDNPETRVALTS